MGNGTNMAATRNEPQQRHGLTPERWQRIKSVLSAALEMDAGERSAYLDSACGDDELMRSEVESLLNAESEFSDDLRLLDLGLPRIGLEAGTKLGDCKIEAPLGSGAMGEVYCARDLRLGRKVAIKVLPGLLSSNPNRLWRFEQEARVAATLSHPNIVSVYQMGTHDGAPYLVSELLEGETLRSVVKRGPLPLECAVDYASQVCRGLAAAQRKGVVHRDLKPENLFVTTEGTIKILDFGLAKLKHRDLAAQNDVHPMGVTETQAGTVLGTAGYMSPEQVRGEDTDHRSDLFSFGAILFEMLTGTRAFHGESFDDVARAILNETPPDREFKEWQVPEALASLTLRCLARDPSQRYQSADDILAELESISRMMDSTGENSPLKASRRRFGKVIWGGIVFAVLAGGSSWFFTHNSARQNGESSGYLDQGSDEVLSPLMTLSGEQHQPSFSPDGKRVAFVWIAPEAKNSGIYQIQVDGQNLQRLTTSLGDYSPTWSPDGSQLAFLHDSQDQFSVHIVPSRGGGERKLYIGRRSQVNKLYPRSSGLSFSRDGRWLAFSGTDNGQEDSIKLLSLEDSSVRALTSHPPGLEDHYPALSPVGDELAFVRSSGPVYVDELYVTSLKDGETRKLTSDHGRIFGPPAFTADGREIVFSSNRAGIESLWRIPVGGGIPRPVSRSGPGAWNPSISRNGRYLAYELSDDEQNIWRLGLQDETHAQGSPQLWIPSGRAFNMLPQFSPDGNKIAFQSSRTGYSEIWICNADGSNLIQVTNNRTLTGSPHWSPDGRYLAFDSRPGAHSEVDIIDVPGGQTRTVARFPDAESVIPSWSHDGKWIYFSSNHGGKTFHIWKVGIENGATATDAPAQISKSIGLAALESRDGRSVLFADPSNPGIWTVPRDGGTESLLWKGPGPDLWSNWVPAKDGLYFFSPNRPGSDIEFLNFTTGQVSHLAKLDKPSFYGLALSPDGRSLLYSQQDRNDHQILLLKDFH